MEPCTTSNKCEGKNQLWRFRAGAVTSTELPAAGTAIESGCNAPKFDKNW